MNNLSKIKKYCELFIAHPLIFLLLFLNNISFAQNYSSKSLAPNIQVIQQVSTNVIQAIEAYILKNGKPGTDGKTRYTFFDAIIGRNREVVYLKVNGIRNTQTQLKSASVEFLDLQSKQNIEVNFLYTQLNDKTIKIIDPPKHTKQQVNDMVEAKVITDPVKAQEVLRKFHISFPKPDQNNLTPPK